MAARTARSQPENAAHALKALAHDRAAQSEMAAQLLNPRKGLAVVQAALDVLIEHPQPHTRDALLELYDYYRAHENRDPACYVRSKIVLALRPVAEIRDLPFFWYAAETYVFPPPQFAEEGGLLRANALLVLGDLDDAVARYAAARLLVDEYTAEMSGEPAVTAAQLLAGLDEHLPLYLYVMQSPQRIVPEVGAEALRGLANLSQPMLDQVIDRFIRFATAQPATSQPAEDEHRLSPTLLAGFFDLLVACDPIPDAGRDYLVGFLRGPAPLDLYRYLTTLLVTTPGDAGWDIFETVARDEDVPARLQLLYAALAVALDQRRAQQVAVRLRGR